MDIWCTPPGVSVGPKDRHRSLSPKSYDPRRKRPGFRQKAQKCLQKGCRKLFDVRDKSQRPERASANGNDQHGPITFIQPFPTQLHPTPDRKLEASPIRNPVVIAGCGIVDLQAKESRVSSSSESSEGFETPLQKIVPLKGVLKPSARTDKRWRDDKEQWRLGLEHEKRRNSLAKQCLMLAGAISGQAEAVKDLIPQAEFSAETAEIVNVWAQKMLELRCGVIEMQKSIDKCSLERREGWWLNVQGACASIATLNADATQVIKKLTETLNETHGWSKPVMIWVEPLHVRYEVWIKRLKEYNEQAKKASELRSPQRAATYSERQNGSPRC